MEARNRHGAWLVTLFVVAVASLLGPAARGQELLTVVINEFGQGRAGNGEWVELLVVGTGPCSTVDLRGFRLVDREGYFGRSFPTRVVFRNVSAWAAVPAGTIIVVYNGNENQDNFPPGFPFNDTDFTDFRVSIPHTNTDFFENVAWGGFGNGGDYVVLVNAGGTLVDGLSYGSLGTDPQLSVHLSAVGANTAAWFTSNTTDHINSTTYWATGSESGGASTPGAGNTPANAAWIASLRPQPAIAVAPPTHDFGPVPVGSSSTAVTVHVTNTGCADLVVGTVALTGADPDQFAIQNDTCSGQTIPPGGSRTLEVVFRPTSPGPKSAQLSVPANVPPPTVALAGTGISVYTIRVSAAPPAGGTVGGGGTYPHGALATVTAVAGSGYRFLHWTEGGTEVSTEAQYTFTVTSDRDLVARFVRLGDANLDGVVDVRDVRLIHQAALGLATLTPAQRLAADVDGDGAVTVADAERVATMILECP